MEEMIENTTCQKLEEFYIKRFYGKFFRVFSIFGFCRGTLSKSVINPKICFLGHALFFKILSLDATFFNKVVCLIFLCRIKSYFVVGQSTLLVIKPTLIHYQTECIALLKSALCKSLIDKYNKKNLKTHNLF